MSKTSNVKARDTETWGNRKKKIKKGNPSTSTRRIFIFPAQDHQHSQLGFMRVLTSHREILFMYHQLALETHQVIIRYLLDFEITF